MQIEDILQRELPPEPWSEGEKIPWNDPEFSQRMLGEHLSQDHDAASRRYAIIDRHVEWIQNSILAGKSAIILDLGCGPGFYTQRLALMGHECVGIDFSPASIAYAKEQAAEHGLSCRYLEGDMRTVEYGSGYGLVMLLFGEFNVFPLHDAIKILSNALHALNPGGVLLLEAHTYEVVQNSGEAPATWYASPGGLFSSRPHLVLQENFWDDKRREATTRYFILDAESGEVQRHAASMQAYTDEDYRAILGNSGFREIEFSTSLGGDFPSEGEFQVITSRKR